MQCPSCHSQVADDHRYCGRCGAEFGSASAPTETSVGDDAATSLSPSVPGDPRERSGFAPGTMILGRYRVVGLLGRGGMGEVYRADDLKLGRTVALKFLPPSVEGDPRRLGRFLNEVRTALAVSHPHVCRVHDIGEVAGRHYLSMEYVDGEDLASLLRRVGRLPPDRAVQAARQLCAGLAAAHDQGILHRDLKPANVMIDGRGQVKITDFGLAGLAGEFAGEEIRAGTPSYMAPEQLAGREVTARSDIYALGLVLYELFTGKPAFRGQTPAEIARGRETRPTSPSSLVADLEPAVERVILRCLERDPQDRPESALAVAAALPGGDPLAEALAAGETPSPQLLAEAGQSGGLKPAVALVCIAGTLIGVALLIALSPRVTLVGRARLDKSPDVLADRARELVRAVGWNAPPGDSIRGFEPNWDYYEHLRGLDPAPGRWDALGATQPAGLRFVYRQSPRPLDRLSQGSIGNWFGDPPHDRPGMVQVRLDSAGRLLQLDAVPPQSASETATAGEPDWSALLAAAGFDEQRLARVDPLWHPSSYADRRLAWQGVYPEAPETPIRIEAAALGRLPVSFRVIEPWTRAAEAPAAVRAGFWQRARDLLSPIWFMVVLIGTTILAARNVRLGRGDTRTAIRFALYLGAARLLWFVGAHHVASGAELEIFLAHLAWSLYRVGLVYVFYLALEPYARRLWPRVLVSWVRLMSGRWRDPLVGRDLLVGTSYGVAMGTVSAGIVWLPQVVGLPGYGLETNHLSWEVLRGIPQAIAGLAAVHVQSALFVFVGTMMFLVLRVLTRRTWIAVAVMSLLALVLFNPGSGHPVPYLIGAGASVVAFWFVFFRFGLLPVVLGATITDVLTNLPLTFDASAWYAEVTLFVLLVVLGLSGWGFWASLAGRPVFRDEILEPEVA